MSTAAFARKEAGAPGKTGKQARLAKVLMGIGHGKADGGRISNRDEHGPIVRSGAEMTDWSDWRAEDAIEDEE
jgi:hypothetical protein